MHLSVAVAWALWLPNGSLAQLPLGEQVFQKEDVLSKTLNTVSLEPAWIGNRTVFRGKETSRSARPFFVLPAQIPHEVTALALGATADMTFGEHNDEADWQPAFEVYVMERAAEVAGVAPEALHAAVAYMDNSVLPFVREAYGCPSCKSCTAFARRYLPDERVRVPAHFDVTAFATVILPLSPGNNFTGGFYVQPGAHVDSRAYVPLVEGDVLVHDFTLNHGIEVLYGGRFSLVIWVSETWEACRGSATPWHADRALAGDLVAAHILGMMYGQGNGAPQDDVQALAWTLLAAEGGLVNAQFSAATMYLEGRGTPIDVQRSFHWYEKAAREGDASAQFLVARMYSEGLGVEQNIGLAEQWYLQGSSQKGASLMGPSSWPR